MSQVNRRISKAFKGAKTISLKDYPKIVIMSDCHRGNGSWADNFINNKPLYIAALKYYYINNFAYIELGDGDELWENRSFKDIYQIHKEIYNIFLDYYKKDKLFMVFGNHDRIKENSKYMMSSLNISIPFFESIIIENGLKKPLFLFHGYQGDVLNDYLWKITRWMVRYLWRPLELNGVKDPTSAAKNYTKIRHIEDRFIKWAELYDCIVIAGHTHRPALPPKEKMSYCNCGSCIHPNTVTALEIEYGKISLVKWSTCANNDMSLYVCKEILAGPYDLP